MSNDVFWRNRPRIARLLYTVISLHSMSFVARPINDSFVGKFAMDLSLCTFIAISRPSLYNKKLQHPTGSHHLHGETKHSSISCAVGSLEPPRC